MSIQAIAWAISYRTGSTARKAVLMVLANYADEKGRCWPSQRLIAKEAEVTDRTVRRVLSDLEAAKVISRTMRRRGDGTRASDCFELTAWTQAENMSACPSPEIDQPDTESAHPETVSGDADMVSEQADTESGHEPSGNHQEPSPLNPPEGMEEEFQKFWAVFPKGRSANVPVNAARKAFEARAVELSPSALAAAGAAYAKTIADAGQIPVSALNFLSAKTGLAESYIPKPADVVSLHPVELGDSPEHQFLAEARAAGAPEAQIRKFAQAGAFRLVTDGAARFCVVDTSENEFRTAFGKLANAHGLSIWATEGFKARKKRRAGK